MKILASFVLGIILGVCLMWLRSSDEDPEAEEPAPNTATVAADDPVEALLQAQEAITSVRFRALVKQVSGREVLPIHDDSAGLLAAVREAAEQTRVFLSDPDGPAPRQRRINEVSRFAEKHLLETLNGMPGIRCEIPSDPQGTKRRSGYPDLLVTDTASGRRAYLDPKLYETDSEVSTLRTFYFQPRRETTKIQHDAHHWLVGFRHDGRTGAWHFDDAKLVDLYEFEIGLKVEFQGSNRDLYRAPLLIQPTGAD